MLALERSRIEFALTSSRTHSATCWHAKLDPRGQHVADASSTDLVPAVLWQCCRSSRQPQLLMWHLPTACCEAIFVNRKVSRPYSVAKRDHTIPTLTGLAQVRSNASRTEWQMVAAHTVYRLRWLPVPSVSVCPSSSLSQQMKIPGSIRSNHRATLPPTRILTTEITRYTVRSSRG